jgi:hypothetical protein
MTHQCSYDAFFFCTRFVFLLSAVSIDGAPYVPLLEKYDLIKKQGVSITDNLPRSNLKQFDRYQTQTVNIKTQLF